MCLIQSLLKQFPELGSDRSIGVISPYKAQVSTIRAKLGESSGRQGRAIDANTIDGFQGREKDASFRRARASDSARARGGSDSSGRTSHQRGIDARAPSLFVVGSAESIRGDANWGGLVAHATEKTAP